MTARLAGIDLNLLSALDALLEARNVTHAARTLGLSQPAASHALRRLRELLDDELLVRTPRGMTPTPRALELRPAVRAAIEAAEAVLRAAPRFDPATAERTFTVAMVDQASFMLMPALVERLAREAPGVRIEIRPGPIDTLTDDVELLVGVFRDRPAGIREAPLFHDDFACILRKGSAASRGRFDLDRYVALSHLFVSPRGTPGSAVDDQLAALGRHRRIALTVPHFLVAPHVIARTDLVWTAPERLGRAFAATLPLVVRDPPIRLTGFDVTMRWHQRLDRDAGLAWLRDILRELAPR